MDGTLHTCANVQIEPQLRHLFMYLTENNQIEDIERCNRSLLSIFSDDVLEMISSHQEGWENMVPNKVARTIKSKGMFGFIEQ